MDNESEIIWHEEATEKGWTMPEVLFWKRWPVIRHVRHVWHSHRVYKAAHTWNSVGIGFGGPAQYDRWVLYGIATGKEQIK